MSKARKDYQCEFCWLQIPKGSEYTRWSSGPWDGESDEVWALTAHKLCAEFMVESDMIDDGISDPREDFETALELLFHIDYAGFYQVHPKGNFGSRINDFIEILKGNKPEVDPFVKLATDDFAKKYIPLFAEHFRNGKAVS